MTTQQKFPQLQQASFITSSWLKWLAIISMLIDHLGAVILEPWLASGAALAYPGVDWLTLDLVLRLIGRLAFPIYSFLIVEGYHHTRDVRRYALRLAGFAFISEIPFDLATSQSWFNLSYQNVFFTLLTGLLAIWVLDRSENFVLGIAAAGGLVLAAHLLLTDYGAYGVLMMLLLHWTRLDRRVQAVTGAIFNFSQMTASLAFIPIYFYNGQKGKGNSKWIYWIYPVHLLLYGLFYRVWLMP